METAESWRALFENWPENIAREGLLVTTFNETIPFVKFMISGGLLLIERDRPDSSDARKVIVPYDAISAIKLTTTAELSQFQAMGFQPPM